MVSLTDLLTVTQVQLSLQKFPIRNKLTSVCKIGFLRIFRNYAVDNATKVIHMRPDLLRRLCLFFKCRCDAFYLRHVLYIKQMH